MSPTNLPISPDHWRQLAAGLFNIPYEEVTQEQRRIAKNISIAIDYGATRSAADRMYSSEEAQKLLDRLNVRG